MSQPAENTSLTPAQRRIRAVERVVAAVSRAGLRLAAAATLGAFGLVCYAIGMRYFFDRPQSWTDEAVGWLMVIIVMFALPEAQRRGDHIGVDVLTERMTGGRRRAFAILGVGTVFACAFLLVKEGIETVLFTRMLGLLSNNIPEIDLWIVQAFVPAGGALLALVAVVQLACYFAGLAPRDMGEHPKDSIE
ncbi:MAG TPA: TRAP transporter small permease [Alphaproteobacteria bacterium]